MELSAFIKLNVYQATVSKESAVLATHALPQVFIILIDARECHAVMASNVNLKIALKTFAVQPLIIV